MPRFYHLRLAWPGRLAELPLVALDVTGLGAVRFCQATARSEFRPRPVGSGLPTPHQPPDGPLGGWRGNDAPRIATVLG